MCLHLRAVGSALLCFCLGAQLRAQAPTSGSARPHQFTAQWITAAGAPAHEPAVIHLRKAITLNAVPAHFVVHVSADNQFLLLVNGVRIGQGPSIGDLTHWRYETYDLAPALHAGQNVVAATVWNLADDAPIRQMTSRLGFVLDPDSPAEAIAATDASWEAHPDPGYRFLPKPAELGGNYYVGSPGEHLDGSTLLWNWAASDAATTTPSLEWGPALVLGAAIARGNQTESVAWQLVADTLPPMELSPEPSGRVVRVDGIPSAGAFPEAPLDIPANTHATLLLDRATLTTAFPQLTVSGGRGATLIVHYAEALVDAQGNKGNRNQIEGKHIVGVFDEFVPDGGTDRTFSPLDWRTWRFLEIDIRTAGAPLRLKSLSTTFTAFPFLHRAQFRSDDASLDAIWQTGWRTARLCAHDAYMDTPYWERLQYVGDTRIQTLISYTNAGDDRLARQAITAFHDSLLPEGITQSRYPSRHLQVITNFSLLWIGMVHDFWYFRNDHGFVRQQLPAMRSELAWFRAHRSPDGLPALQEWWPFVDWATGFPGGDSPATPDGINAAASLFYLEALQNAAELERGLGVPALAADDAAEAARLRNTIYTRFWSADDQLLADTPEHKHFSQQANALAIWLDVIPPARQQALLERLLSASDPGFPTAGKPLPAQLSLASNYFRFYLTRALVHAGMASHYQAMLAPWRTMLENGLSTWAEQPEPTRSDSHAWSAHPNIDLLTTVAGIMPAAPNFASVRIRPALGALHHLAVTYPSPRGDIVAEFTTDTTRTRAVVTLPPQLSGVLEWNHRRLSLHPGTNRLVLPLLPASARTQATRETSGQ